MRDAVHQMSPPARTSSCETTGHVGTPSARPLVTIVLPTHNRAALMPRATRSVLAQTWKELELVIVDDASSDATPEILAELAATDPRVRIVRRDRSQTAGNPENPRNDGLAAARGEYVGFLDDDDRYQPRF